MIKNLKGRPYARLFGIRHFLGDKSNLVPQMPTIPSEIVSYAMGVLVRHEYCPDFVGAKGSPQPRGYRTGSLFLAGIEGVDVASGTSIHVERDGRLNDFSTDVRPVVFDGMEAAKQISKNRSISVESALFESEAGLKAVELKVEEAMEVLDQLIKGEPGDYFMGGLHHPTIDGIILRLAQRCYDGVPFAIPTIPGGQINHCEGFVAVFDEDQEVLELKLLRVPTHLLTLTTSPLIPAISLDALELMNPTNSDGSL